MTSAAPNTLRFDRDRSAGVPAQRLRRLIQLLALLAVCASVAPFLFRAGPGPEHHVSIRGMDVMTYGYGPYRHMPADVAVQGLAQDLVTAFIAVPLLLASLAWARRGSRAGHLALTGAVAYLFVQYVLYLAMAMYNELYLVWVALVLCASQALFRLLLGVPARAFVLEDDALSLRRRRFVAGFLLVNGTLITLLWLQVIVPPLLAGTLYPAGLSHFTTMVVQGFDLALFIPPSIVAGWAYAKKRLHGHVLAPVYVMFLTIQMTALLAKIAWMSAVGASAGPALVLVPLLLVGAAAATWLALAPHRNTRIEPSAG